MVRSCENLLDPEKIRKIRYTLYKSRTLVLLVFFLVKLLPGLFLGGGLEVINHSAFSVSIPLSSPGPYEMQ